MGEKTASKWIIEYGSLQALVDKVDTVKGKVGESLRANLSHVILNRDLTELVKDVPLPQTPDTLRMMPWDRDQIHRLFDDLEFRVLRDRLFDTLASADPEVEQGFDVRGGVLERGQLAAWLAEHGAGQRFGLAVVGNHLAFDSDATALAIVSADGEGCYLDTSSLEPGDEAALASWLADPGITEVAARGQARDARPRRSRLGAGRRHLRYRAGRLPGAAGSAQLRPRRPRGALSQARAARGKP